MTETLTEILKRTSVFLLVLGAILLVIGASGDITLGSNSLALPDTVARIVVGVFGAFLLFLGIYSTWQETFQQPRRIDVSEFDLIASRDTSKQSFRLERYIGDAKTIDLLGYTLKGLLRDLREPLVQAIIRGAIVRIIVVDVHSTSTKLFEKHTDKPELVASNWITGLQYIKDIRTRLEMVPKVSGRFEVKVTSWIPSNNLVLVNANTEDGILKAGIHSVTFRQPISDRLTIVIRREKYKQAFDFFAKGFDLLWNKDSVVWDGEIPSLG